MRGILTGEVFSRTTGRRAPLLFASFIAILVTANAMFAERINLSDGLGFGDGRLYAHIAQAPLASTIGRESDSYALQRVLPGVVVGITLRIAGHEPTNHNIINGFEALDALLVVASAFVWGAIARRLQLSLGAFLVGGVACFVNFAQLKQMPFYATLTDTSAFAVGMVVMYFYLRESFLGLALTAAIAAFVWPVAVALTLPLLLWPRGALPVSSPEPRVIDIGTLVAGAVVGILAVGFVYTYVYRGLDVVGFGPIPPIVRSMVPLSVAAFWGIAFAALRALLRGVDLDYIMRLIRETDRRRALVAIVLVIATRAVTTMLQKPDSVPILPARVFAGVLAFTPVVRPLIWLVGNVVYFGPWVLLVVLRWRSIARITRREGAGLLALVTGATILGFLPESRQSIFAVPAFATLLAMVWGEKRVKNSLYALIALASVAFSKIWLTIGPADENDLAGFRRYFMNHGVYMDAEAYAVQGTLVLILLVMLWWLTRSRTEKVFACAEPVSQPRPRSVR